MTHRSPVSHYYFHSVQFDLIRTTQREGQHHCVLFLCPSAPSYFPSFFNPSAPRLEKHGIPTLRWCMMNNAYVTLHFLHPVRCIRNPRATVSTIPDAHCNSRLHLRQRHGALIFFLFRSCIHSLRVPVYPTPLPSHREPQASRVARAHRFGHPGVCVYARPVVTPGRPRTPGVGCGEQDVRKTPP